MPITDLKKNYLFIGIPQRKRNFVPKKLKNLPLNDTSKNNSYSNSKFYYEAVLDVEWLSYMFKLVCKSDSDNQE